MRLTAGPGFDRHVGGRPQCVSPESQRKTDAIDMLKDREGKVVNGVPLTAKVGKFRFEERRRIF